MSTRAQIRFATRETGVNFNEHPDAIHAQFYKHSDGYPEGLGVDISESLLDSTKLCNWDQVGECIFVGEPQKLLDKYKTNTDYDG